MRRKEESEARQQGPVHLKDVPEGGFGHLGAEEPAGRRLRSFLSLACEWFWIFVTCCPHDL